MLNLVDLDTSSPTWRIADLADQIRLAFARREWFPHVRAPSTHEIVLFVEIYGYFTLCPAEDEHEISWYCHRVAHGSILLHESATSRSREPTYLYFLTVLHAHLPPGNDSRNCTRSNFNFVKHLFILAFNSIGTLGLI